MSSVRKMKPAGIGPAATLMAAAAVVTMALCVAAPGAHAANAVLDGGKKTIKSGDRAVFEIKGAAGSPTDLAAQCTISDVTGRAVITFDGEGYVPLSEPAIGDRLTLNRGDEKTYSLHGAIQPSDKGESYVAFSMIDQPASLCFPGMECGGKDQVASKVTVSCKDGAD